MKPPTCARPGLALLLLLALLAVAVEASAGHSRRGRYHHHQHEEHRARRIRREQGTDAPIKKPLPCTKAEDCLELTSSICALRLKICLCPVLYPILDEENKQCLKSTSLNHTCQFDLQCHDADELSYCSEVGTCICQEGFNIVDLPHVGLNCVSELGSTSEAKMKATAPAGGSSRTIPTKVSSPPRGKWFGSAFPNLQQQYQPYTTNTRTLHHHY